MTVFKNYIKIAKTFLPIIIVYTAIFLGITTVGSNSNQDLVVSTSKPKVVMINEDNSELSKVFEAYVKQNSEIVDIEKTEETLKDALFIRQIDCVLTIPENFSSDILTGKSPKIETVKVPDSFSGMYAEMLYNRFWNTAETYARAGVTEQQIADSILGGLEEKAAVSMIESNQGQLEKASFFYNFQNYSLLAMGVLIVGMIINIFNDVNIKRRNTVSPISYQKFNRQLFFANACVIFLIWAVYAGISMVLYQEAMFSTNGLLFLLNSFVFASVVLSIAFLVGNLVRNKEAQNGIVNVLALGSSFLCGAFVPQEMLGASVLVIGKVLPSYWYIKNNNDIAKLTEFNMETLQPILMNMGIVLLFTIGLFIITNVISKVKLKK